MTVAELETKTLADLREMARKLDISGISSLKKRELIDKLIEAQNAKQMMNTAPTVAVVDPPPVVENNAVDSTIVERGAIEFGTIYSDGILDIMPEGFGFLRGNRMLPRGIL
jgi:transcription termination factor Rho